METAEWDQITSYRFKQRLIPPLCSSVFMPMLLSWTEIMYVNGGLDVRVLAQSHFTWLCSDAACTIHKAVASYSEKLQEYENKELQLCGLKE